MNIRILGAHNTESQNTRHTTLLIDNIVALDAGGLTSTLSIEEQLKIKAVLLTHSHYDHIRDIPALAMNLYMHDSTVDIYTHQAVYDNLIKYLLDGEIYPEFHKRPQANPTIRLNILEPLQNITIEGYDILPVPVNHSIPAMGYQITSPDGKIAFYTGDTGMGLSRLWQNINPQILFIEVTASNQWIETAKKSGHLTANLLEEELIQFKEIKGYLPQVIAVHLNLANEDEIRPEITSLANSIKTSINLAHEGMLISI